MSHQKHEKRSVSDGSFCLEKNFRKIKNILIAQ